MTLQLDSPDLGLGRHMMGDRDEAEYLTRIERHVEVLNAALRDVPSDRARMHVAGQLRRSPSPRRRDGDDLAGAAEGQPAGLLFETANPRHQHDLEAFTDHRDRIPDDKVLILGVIDTTTNFIEHPHVVANRLRGSSIWWAPTG